MRLLDLYYDFKELFWGPCTAPWGKKKHLSHRNTGKILTNSETLYIKQSLTRGTLRNQ